MLKTVPATICGCKALTSIQLQVCARPLAPAAGPTRPPAVHAAARPHAPTRPPAWPASSAPRAPQANQLTELPDGEWGDKIETFFVQENPDLKALPAGQSGRLGEALAGHHGLVRLHLKAQGCS